MATDLRGACGLSGATRADLVAICNWLRARVRTGRLEAAHGGTEALLVPLPDNKFGIRVDPTPPGGWGRVPDSLRDDLHRHRLRFRVGHEIGHVFSYSRQRGERAVRSLPDSRTQEEFCDVFSRRLLVPERLAAGIPSTPEALIALQGSCDVSLEVAARAMAEARGDLRISIWFGRGPRGELKPQWSSTPEVMEDGPAALQELRASHPDSVWLPERSQLVAVA